ncbi:MAG: hypothetical protein ACRDJK_02385, partial [Actinomycetota bacterium]
MAGLTSFELPSCLERIYGGSVGFEPPALFTNFVASIDGVVALEGDAPPSVIRGASPADLF